MDLHARIVSRLKNLADACEGRRLPSVRALAAEWTTSLTTVQKAIKAGVEGGWLETRPGSGVWAAGSLPHPAPHPPRWDALRLIDAITNEIETGTFGPGQTLPSPKTYSTRFGIHPATARKALSALTAQGLIERDGRTWRMGHPQKRKAGRNSVIWCFGAADQDGNLRMDTDREWDFWREIQIEAIRSGLSPKLTVWNGSVPDSTEDVLGAVVSTWHMEDTTPVLDALLRQHIPTAVWVANHEVLPGRGYRSVRGMWFHDLGYGMDSGETMARYIAGLGAKKIAWISPFHGSTWSQNRLLGLRVALGRGFEIAEANGSWTSEWDVLVKVMADPEVRSRLDLHGLGLEDASDALIRPLEEAITRSVCLEAFGPRLQDAFDSGATLWVAASDLAAQWCLHWLRTSGSQRTKDISLVGFDDSREASRLGLTSLRFDVQGMARAMIRQILSSRREHRLFTRHTGQVVERNSTAPLRDGR